MAEDAVARYLEEDPPHDLRDYYKKISEEKKLTPDKHPNRRRWFWQWVVIVAGAAFSSILILLA